MGRERAWALRFISLGGKLAGFSTTLTPWLCVRLGWQGTAYTYGVFTLAFSALWETVAFDRPPTPAELIAGRLPPWPLPLPPIAACLLPCSL